MILSVALFTLGSGIAGGSASVAMLIAGRTVQGIGSGGIFMLVDLIVCDLVSLRERGKYLGIMLSTAAVGAILGPVLGGLLAQANWRWVFYINVPIAVVVLIIMVFFLKVTYKKEPTWKAALSRVDWIGTMIFISSICAVLLGLLLGGSVFPWSSWRIIVPLVLGFAGWAVFHIYESSRFCKEPSIPPRLFGNRTSLIGFFLACDAAALLQWIIYYLPVYFQGVLQNTPLVSGIDLLPFNAFIIPAAILSGAIMSKTGFYRSLHRVGFSLVAIGGGLLTLLDAKSSKAHWVIFQMFGAIGEGFLIPTILPAIQASLPTSEVATATGTYAFVRSFGFVWGVIIPGIIFTREFDRYSNRISDSTVRARLTNGKAYAYASATYRISLPARVEAEIVSVYIAALKTVWHVVIAFALLGLAATFIEKHVELKTSLETEFGLGNDRKAEDQTAHELEGR
ncbi:MAG: hypothetical protein M1816_001610 [Peltula sp. TS41687]|nr:MAG: hypothetical protein M1816_001610 [Peltula sp. TS41687]